MEGKPDGKPVERAPMSRTILWLSLVPFSLPAWLVRLAWSNGLKLLKRNFQSTWEYLTHTAARPKECATASSSTDLTMAELDRLTELLNLQEESMAIMFDHQQQQERTRQEQERVPKPLDDYVVLLRQCMSDLQNRNARLQTTLGEVVLPALERACSAQVTVASGMPAPAAEAQLLAALMCTRQALAEAESGSSDCSSGEVSPVGKSRDDGADQQPSLRKIPTLKSAPPTCAKVLPVPGLRDPTLSPPHASKVLPFGRPTALVHVLAHDF